MSIAAAAAVVLGVVAAALCLPAAAARGPHMADLSVLLPPRMTNPVEYLLKGSDGCFSWTWDHHDVLSVTPEYNDSRRCSTSARLASIAPYSGRRETSVYATDLISGITIHCKVFIDNISRIRIFHHAVKIDLDDFATLHIRAFDDEENVFSSLVGLQFLWKLSPRSLEADSNHYLVHVPLKETPLSDCSGFCSDLDTRIKLEDGDLGSDLLVIKGIEIGQEMVSAQLFEPQFKHVVDTIILTVAEAMSLEPPSPVLVTVGALIKFKLRVIRQNIVRVVNLPSQYHQWRVTNSSVAQVDSGLGIAHALNLGFTDVVVEDIRVSGHVQVSSVHVVIPHTLFLYLVPIIDAASPFHGIVQIPSSEVWYVFPGQKYIVLLKAFAEGFEANELYITEENELKLESSTLEFWNLSHVPDDIIVSNRMQNSRLLSPVSQGKGSLVASLSYQEKSSEPAKVLKLVHEVNVCNKVKIIFDEGMENSDVIHLPWVPGVFQELELKAVGGCGKTPEDYKLFSSNEGVVSVSHAGIVRAKMPGQATIKLVSALDFLNYDEVIIEVSIPSMLGILPMFPVEVVVGTQLHAAVTLRTSNGSSFARCDYFNPFIKWTVLSENASFEIVETAESFSIETLKQHADFQTLYGNPCAWAYLTASGAGRATVVATFSYDSQSYFEPFSGPIFLKATSTISAYYPLVVFQAGNGNRFGGYWADSSGIQDAISSIANNTLKELHIVPGSTMDIFLFGGPERWDQRVEFIETLDVIGEKDNSIGSSLTVQKLSNRLYRVYCQNNGSFKLLLSRGNLIGKDHPMPAVAKSELAVVCDFPSTITLIANEDANTHNILEAVTKADRGPGRLQTSPIVISNGRSVRLAAAGVHGNERFFANSSSLCLRWEVIGCEGLAFWDQTKGVEMLEESGWERFLVLQNSTGLCIVRATVIGVFPGIAGYIHEKARTFIQSAKDNLTDAVQLQIVSSLRVIPDSVLLVFHPEAQEKLSVSGGTCFLDASTNDTRVVEIIGHPGKMLCSQLLLGARGLGSALVTVRDIGLSPVATAASLVRVANVDWIEIISEEHISLMEGSTKDFQILAGTQDGDVFEDSQYIYMGIEVHLGDELLELINSSLVLDGPKFSIKAAKIGTTSLYVSSKQQSGHRILSQLVKVEVYKPLQIYPAYIYLAPGASFLLAVKGGPKIGVSLEYTSLNKEIVEVHNTTGKLSAKIIGNATVRAAVMANGGTFICEAYGRVEVEIPVAMTLSAQSDRLCVGCSMPVYPSLAKGDLFSFYETCQSYSWIIANEKVVMFQSARSLQYGVDEELSLEGKDYPWLSKSSSNAFVNRLIGRSAGKTKISVSISCDFVLPGGSQSVFYNASKTILVVPDPPLALGIPITWLFPPFYTSSALLPRSADSFGESGSNELEGTITYSLLWDGDRSEIMKQDTITIDGSKIRTGESNEVDCIQAKDQSTGRAEIASCLRVAEVAQVRVAAAESSFHMAYLPVNAKVELDIKYADELGYIFKEAHGMVPVKVETNYPDVVSILTPKDNNCTHGANEHFVLVARSPGTALVRLNMIHNPKKADFVMVSVGAQMYPRDPVVHVGHHLNFTLVGDYLDAPKSGRWSSSNEKVIRVNGITGEAHAHGDGVAEVFFKSSNLKLQTTVAVVKVNQIVVDAPAETLTNAPVPSEGYKFSVKFSDPTSHKTGSSGSQISVPYDCKVEPAFVGHTEPWRDHATKKSYCLFFPYAPGQLSAAVKLRSKIKPEMGIENAGFVHITIIAGLREDPNVTGSAHALFIEGFDVKEPRKLNLMPSCNQSVITIVGNTDVELFWSARDLLSVSRVDENEKGRIPGHVVYQVEALKRRPFSDKVTIVLPATGQTEEVDVNYEIGEKAEPSRSSFALWALLLSCAIVPVATVIFFMKLLEKPSRSVTPSRQAVTSSPVTSPATPDRLSPANIQSSPHTPQPFMEYVRRTIDETPYYKRDGRRRYNPQNTY